MLSCVFLVILACVATTIIMVVRPSRSCKNGLVTVKWTRHTVKLKVRLKDEDVPKGKVFS